MIVRFDRRSFRCCAPFAPMPCIISHLTQVTWRNTYTEFTERNETKWNPDDAILSNVVGKKHMKENHSTVHLPIFFWVGFRWDGHYEPEMGGMDPTCRHPKPRPTNPRDFLTHHYFRTKMESSKSPRILIRRCFQKLCAEPFLVLERKEKL